MVYSEKDINSIKHRNICFLKYIFFLLKRIKKIKNTQNIVIP